MGIWLTFRPHSVLVNGTNPWQDKFRRMEREARRARALQKAAEGKGDGSHNAVFDDDSARHHTTNTTNTTKKGTLVDIEEVIEQNDKAEEERRRVESDKIWQENEGLLSGEMV